MKQLFKLLFFSIGLILLSSTANATHIAGGDISYQWVGPNRYVVTLNLFRDCSGTTLGTTETLRILNSCGLNVNRTIPLINPGGSEISQLCSSELVNSTCSGGALPGMQRYTFRDTIDLAVLSAGCITTGTWNFAWTSCCRNDSENLVGQDDMYINSELNLASDNSNNSPYFTSDPIPYVCSGQPINYNYGVVETENDSLRYSFVAPQDGAATNVPNQGTYTATNPIPGITINPITGQINFTAPGIGNYVVSVKVMEYDRATTLLKGFVLRDIQFVVIACTNIPPESIGDGITTFNAVITSFTAVNGTPSVVSANSIQGCEGDRMRWQTEFSDIDPSNILTITTNYAQIFPSTVASFSISGTNPLTVTWDLIIPSGAAGLTGATRTFSVTVSDQACPIPGNQTFTYNVNATPATYAGLDWVICGTQIATPTAYGGNIFTWYDLANVQIPVDPTSFTCNPCASPTIKPANVGTYTFVVQSNLTGGCKNRDTIVVNVTNNFLPTLTQTDSICLGVPIVLDVTPISSATLSYTYNWAPITGLNNSTTANPTATFLTGGIYTYTATITSNEGCIKRDTTFITVSPNRDPLYAQINQEVPICIGGTANLSVTFGVGDPSSCDLSTSGVCTGITNFDSGVSTGNSTGTDQTPFKGFYEDGRIVSLYKASELIAQGITPGKIQGLILNISAKNSSAPYNNFTIKMGCTGLTALTANFISGLTQVYSTASYSSVSGLNAFSFATPYEWDGISNLLIEVCFDNDDYTSNDNVAIENTTYASSASDYADFDTGCNLNFPTTLNNRPVYTFDWCAASPNPNSFTYAWSPATGLSATNVNNPSALPPTNPFSYTVLVTDKIGGCNVTTTKAISFTSPFDASFSYGSASYCKNLTNPTPTLVSTASSSFGSFSSSPAGIFFTNTTNGTINLSASLPNTYSVTRTITYTSGSCPNSVATYTVVVLPTENASFSYSSSYFCENTGLIETPVKTDPSVLGTFSYTANPITSTLHLVILDGTIDINQSDIGTYTVKFTSSGTCASTFTKTFTIGVSPTSLFTYSLNPYCKNGANPVVTLGTGSQAGTYTVFASNPTTATLNFVNQNTGQVNIATSSAGTYTVLNSVNLSGCPLSTYSNNLTIVPVDVSSFSYSALNYCIVDGTKSPTLMPTAAGSFTATPAGMNIDPTTGDINLSLTTPNTYTVRFNSTGICTSTFTKQVRVYGIPSSTISYNPQSSCEGSGALIPVTLGTGVVSTGIYTFPVDLIQSGTTPGTINVNLSIASPNPYIVTYTVSSAFCVGSDTALFYVRPKDDASFSYTATNTFCQTGTNPLPIITGVTGGSFSSSASGISIIGTTGEISLSNSQIGGPYVVVYTTPVGGTGCTNNSIINVTITEGQTAAFIYEDPYCINNAINTDASPTFGAGSFAGLFTSTPDGLVFENENTGKINLAQSKPGQYTVTNTLAETATCAAALATDVVDLIGTNAAFTADKLTGVKPLDVTFTNLSTGAISYKWDFGNSDTSDIASPNYKYIDPGMFNVILTSTAGPNCIDTASVSIHVDNTSIFVIPNVFSPDGDGVNDVFNIKVQAIQDFECRIYNRWGKKVYEWSDENAGWNGENYPQGVYFYVIYAKGIDGIVYDKNGTVTLYRK